MAVEADEFAIRAFVDQKTRPNSKERTLWGFHVEPTDTYYFLEEYFIKRPTVLVARAVFKSEEAMNSWKAKKMEFGKYETVDKFTKYFLDKDQ